MSECLFKCEVEGGWLKSKLVEDSSDFIEAIPDAGGVKSEGGEVSIDCGVE